jgi:hypothetical protein
MTKNAVPPTIAGQFLSSQNGVAAGLKTVVAAGVVLLVAVELSALPADEAEVKLYVSVPFVPDRWLEIGHDEPYAQINVASDVVSIATSVDDAAANVRW